MILTPKTSHVGYVYLFFILVISDNDYHCRFHQVAYQTKKGYATPNCKDSDRKIFLSIESTKKENGSIHFLKPINRVDHP